MIRDLHKTALNGKRPHKRSKSRDIELKDSMDFSEFDDKQTEKIKVKQASIQEMEFKLVRFGFSIKDPHSPCGRFWKCVPQRGVNF